MASVRVGESQRAVARRFGVSLYGVQFWLRRAGDRRLDRVDWADRRSGPRRSPTRTGSKLEARVVDVRRRLRDESVLGEYGAAAIQRELQRQEVNPIPCVRTIHRILTRHGAVSGRERVRHPAPPRGWYLPAVAHAKAELDQFDLVEGLVIQDGPQVEILNAISLHGGLAGSWPRAGMTARKACEALIRHWRRFGLPSYAQFDNDTVFQGPHQHPDAVGTVIRLCLSLGVTPVFAPPRETGFQAAIESFNARWQAKVWRRFRFESLKALQSQATRYATAHCRRNASRRDAAPDRRRFHVGPLGSPAALRGKIIFLRRTTEKGTVVLLGRPFQVVSHWVHRLVRCEVELNHGVIRFYALRRRNPQQQPLLREAPYQLPARPFRG